MPVPNGPATPCPEKMIGRFRTEIVGVSDVATLTMTEPALGAKTCFLNVSRKFGRSGALAARAETSAPTGGGIFDSWNAGSMISVR